MSEQPLREWERRDKESPEAYGAFRIYLDLGASRSLAKVAQQSGKHISLIERWSKPAMHGWLRRARMWDRHEARVLRDDLLVAKAAMRKRLVVQAQNLQHLAYQRVASMTPKEIARLSPGQIVLLFKAGAEYEMKARDIPIEEIEAGERDKVPTFHINFIPPRPDGFVTVGLANGQGGYIPAERVDDFKAKYPDAVLIK